MRILIKLNGAHGPVGGSVGSVGSGGSYGATIHHCQWVSLGWPRAIKVH